MKAELIGCGYWGQILIPYIKEKFDLIAIHGQNYRLKKDSQVVFIATPMETHYEIAKKCLLNGKHVFCEKPLTMHYEQALKLKEIAKEQGLKLYTDYLEVFTLEFDKYKKVEHIEIIFKQFGKFIKHGVLWQLGSHELSILSLFFSLKDLEYKYIIDNDTCKIYNDEITLECSRVSNKRQKKVIITYEDGKQLKIDKLKEKHNIRTSIQAFIDGYNNIDMAIEITHILEALNGTITKG